MSKIKKIHGMKYKHIVIISMLLLILAQFSGCKTDSVKKKDAEQLYWSTTLKADNSFLKEAVKELDEVKGENLVVSKYNSPRTREEVIDFFTNYTNNRYIAEVILKYSVKYNVPPTLAFAVSFSESSFNPVAINMNSSSIDRGLFQLNSNSFPNLTKDDFFNIDKNTSYGVEFIRWCLDTGENEVSALAMYNAGSGRVSGRGTPKMTLDYISRVLDYRTKLVNEFNSEMSSFAKINPQSIKLVKDVTKH